MSMAGELLGEKNQEKLFGLVLKREENNCCADCRAKAPTWVSLDFGVFVCMNCSGAHRHLSRNVTRVYSTKIDSWNKSNFQIMDHVGNEIANSYWEFKHPTRRISFNSQPDERIRFVTDKYLRKLYANPKSQNPVLIFIQKRDKGILERPYQHKDHINQLTVNLIGEKEFISNGAAGSKHNDMLRKELKENGEKKFSSVTSPPMKPIVDLMDMDDDIPAYSLTQGEIKTTMNRNYDDNNFSNFVSAPQNTISTPSLLDMYNQTKDTTINTKDSSKEYPPNHFNSHYVQTPPQINIISCPTYSNQTQQHAVNNQQEDQNSQGQNKSAQHQNNSVDLMSLYNQNPKSTTTTLPSTQISAVLNQPVINQIPPADKNRYQAFNQMGHYGTYFPQYHQGYPNMIPNLQNHQYQQQHQQQQQWR